MNVGQEIVSNEREDRNIPYFRRKKTDMFGKKALKTAPYV